MNSTGLALPCGKGQSIFADTKIGTVPAVLPATNDEEGFLKQNAFRVARFGRMEAFLPFLRLEGGQV